MFIPYDVFSNIITLSDMKTIFNLYHTDRKLQELCLNNNFGKVLFKMSHNPYFNLHTKSNLLDKFLNDIADAEMLDKLQLKLANSLVDKITIIATNSIKDNVNDVLSDQITNNNKILFYGYNNGKSTLIDLLRKLELSIDFYCEYHGKEKYDKNKLYDMITKNVIYCEHIIKTNTPITKFKFNCINNNITNMRNLLVSDQNTLSALLNFLLEGYRKSLV